MTAAVRPTDATLGAVVTDVDLRALDEGTWAAIESAWHDNGVLIFPDQHLSNDEQVAFSKRFGSLERLAASATRTTRVDISRLSNLRPDGTLVTDEHAPSARMLIGNMDWHSDSSFRPVAAKASLLSAHVVAASGGNTEFADMRAAYDALDAAMQARLEGLHVTHSYAYSQGRVGGLEAVFTPEARAEMVDVEHPLVAVHPATGRRSLFIGRHAYRIGGMDDADAQALLADLLANACQPPRVLVHRWRVGDIVVWDNRCVLHRARPWSFSEPRVMFHTRVAGDGANAYALLDGR